MIKGEKHAITLIALVVTVVVLLILAGVSLNLILNNRSVINNAKDGRESQIKSQRVENIKLLLADTITKAISDSKTENDGLLTKDNVEKEIQNSGLTDITVSKEDANNLEITIENAKYTVDKKTGEIKEGELSTKIKIADVIGKDVLSNTDNTEVFDDNNNKVTVPAKFKIPSASATDVNKGVVIEEDQTQNQFVWVPVPDPTVLYIKENNAICVATTVVSTMYSNLRQRTQDTYSLTKPGVTTVGIREPDLLSDYDSDSNYYNNILGYSTSEEMGQSVVDDYTNMINSVNSYNGFYVGRYELTGSVAAPTVVKGTVLTADVAGNWYYFYKACRNIINTNEHVATSMVWGCQWDQIMIWLKSTQFAATPEKVDTNSTTWGNYSNSTGDAAAGHGIKHITGYSDNWKANNIYDLAGNAWEWTQECSWTSAKILRGGDYELSGTAIVANKRNTYPINSMTDYHFSTRATMYIKP